jgi:hypothetical protein
MLRETVFLALLPALVFLLLPSASSGSEYTQVHGLIDFRSTFSDGDYDIETLAEMAKKRGFDVLVINDHDRMAMEYGLLPFRNIVKKKVEKNSINRQGAGKYLDSINDARKKFPDMILLPGSESAAFYYWTGSYFENNLTAHNHERRILTIGMEKKEDYENLPVLHNSAKLEFTGPFLAGVFIFLCSAAASFFLIKWGGFYRLAGIIIIVAGAAFVADNASFKTSPFDQYHGDRGIAPYQLLIDYVDSRGGMTFWNYPETQSGVRTLGPIRVDTPPYPEALEQSRDYTGFAALYGDNITVTEPGNVWDRVLISYCEGSRKRPVWGISAADFHAEGESGEKMGNFRTIFLLREKNKKEVMDALRNGRMYAYRGSYPQFARLNEFSVSAAGGYNKGISGGEIMLSENPVISISISSETTTEQTVKVRLIRSGELIGTFEGRLPMQIDYEDKYRLPGKKTYYRMDMNGYGTLVSNPVFVSFSR